MSVSLCRWKDHHFTGHNSPLYAQPDEMSENHPGYQMNSDFAIRYWMSLGAPASKLLLGMGAYGRGFNLQDASNNGLYAPATSGIDAAMYTSASGFWGYNEFCEKMRTERPKWTIIRVSSKILFFPIYLWCQHQAGLTLPSEMYSKRNIIYISTFLRFGTLQKYTLPNSLKA